MFHLFHLFHFASPKIVRALLWEGKRVVDVSSRAVPPHCYLSPFYPHGGIRVPGMQGEVADSVEGVWQGLKVIRGRIAPEFFRGPGRKRRGRGVAGHRYGDRLISYRDARHLIYVPLYREMVARAPLARAAALALLRDGLEREVWIHDVEENGEIEDLAKPLAHAAVLVDLLNENMAVHERLSSEPEFRAQWEAEKADNGHPLFPLAEALFEKENLSRGSG